MFSEPPGPGVFQFQGVPRDPILRPKTRVSILNGKSHFSFSPFYHFSELAFSPFSCFAHFDEVDILVGLIIFCIIGLRPIGYYREENDVMCGGSPLIHFGLHVWLPDSNYMSGRIHRSEHEIYNSRSPLSEPDFYLMGFVLIIRVGEIHRVVLLLYSRSPLCFGFSFGPQHSVISCRGDSQERSNI